MSSQPPAIPRSWRVRADDDQGDGKAVSLDRLSSAIENGVWNERDQARGPQDRVWRLIGEHPQLEEFVPPKPLFRSRSSEEAEMDMTPMIDVTFQLLIFFMIAATYVVQKTLDVPKSDPSQEGTGAVTMQELEKNNLIVKLAADRSVTVQGKAATLDTLMDALRAAVRENQQSEMVLDADDQVDHQSVIKALDAAAGAKIEKVHFVSRVGPSRRSVGENTSVTPPPAP